jgi:DNA-binding PadR family transcriptional regulator
METPGCAKGSAWALLVAMANRGDDDGIGIFESIKSLSADCGISESTGWRALHDLLRSGLVVKMREMHKDKSGHYTCCYRIDVSKLVKCKPDATQPQGA